MRAWNRLQDPATVAIHDWSRLLSRSESERCDSSAGVDITDLGRREVAVVTCVRDCRLVDESFGIPRRRRGREGCWVDGEILSDRDRLGAKGSGEMAADRSIDLWPSARWRAFLDETVRRASMAAGVDVIDAVAGSVGLALARLLRSILLGKYGSIVFVYLGGVSWSER